MFKDMSFAAPTCEPTGMPAMKRLRPRPAEVPKEHEEKWLERMFFVAISETLDGIIMDTMPGVTEAVDGNWIEEGFKPEDYGFPSKEVDSRMDEAVKKFEDAAGTDTNYILSGDDEKVERLMDSLIQRKIRDVDDGWSMENIEKTFKLFMESSKIILDSYDSDSDAAETDPESED
jgi:hypothetical protein